MVCLPSSMRPRVPSPALEPGGWEWGARWAGCPPQGIGFQAEMTPVRGNMSSTWVYLHGASAPSGRRMCVPDLWVGGAI